METIATGVISSLITGIVAIIVCNLNNKHHNNVSQALYQHKMDELIKRVDKHNHLIERMYCVEEKQSLQEEKIKVANHRIEDLEKERQT